MKTPKSNAGFTLVETMIATAIGSLVFAQLAVTVLACHRLVRETLDQSEMAIRTRVIRDKLLFHAAPAVEWAGNDAPNQKEDLAGLLSGTSVTVGSAQLSMMSTNVATGVSGQQQVIHLNGDSCGNYLVNQYASSDQWLRPGVIDLSGDWDDIVDGSEQATKKRITITLSLKVDGVTRTERLLVPLFLVNQPAEESL